MTHTILLVGLKNGDPVNHCCSPMSATECTYEVIVLQEGYAFTTESGKTITFSLTPLRFPDQLLVIHNTCVTLTMTVSDTVFFCQCTSLLYVETRPPVIWTGKNEYGRVEIWVDGYKMKELLPKP